MFWFAIFPCAMRQWAYRTAIQDAALGALWERQGVLHQGCRGLAAEESQLQGYLVLLCSS